MNVELIELLGKISPLILVLYIILDRALPVILGYQEKEQEREKQERLFFAEKIIEVVNTINTEMQLFRVEIAKLTQTNIMLINLLLKEKKDDN